jgi:hypothetical protein
MPDALPKHPNDADEPPRSPTPRSAAETAALHSALVDLFERRISFNQVLDTPGGLALMVEIAQRFPSDNTLQVMHRFTRMGTIDLRVDFLRQGLGQQFTASAEVTRLGARIGSTQMRLANDTGVLIATAAAAYVVA